MKRRSILLMLFTAFAMQGCGSGGGLDMTPSTVRCAGETRTLRIQVPDWADRWTRIRGVVNDLDAGSELASDVGALGDLVDEFSTDGHLGFVTTSTTNALECRLPNGHYELVLYEDATDRLLARGDFRVER
jgi:hypothetical protein